jgi:hypothetical protein
MKHVMALVLGVLVSATAFGAPAPQAKSSGSAKKTAKKTASSDLAAQINELRQAFEAQQRQIQQLQQDMRSKDAALQQAQQQAQQAQQQLQQAQASAAAADEKATAAQTAANEQKDTVSKLNSDMVDVKTTLTNTAVGTQDEQKRMSALEGLVGRFRFNGDIRVRGESFFQGCVSPCLDSKDAAVPNTDRQRARIRVRFGFDGKLNEDFTAGISLATGTLGDPTSTNTTLTNFFDKHTIGLDRGYINYHPSYAKWASITAGKFAYTWQRTSVTFDPDLNPEGFTEKFSLDFKHPVLKNINFQGMQLVYNEASKATDSWAYGMQVGARMEYGPWSMTPSFLLLKFNQPDALLNASQFSVQQSPGEGPGCQKANGVPTTDCVFAPNGMTNATYADANGVAHFYSQFFYADVILNNQIKTGLARLPLNILAEYEQNLDAKSHPLDANGAVIASLGGQDKAYLVDVSLGQTKNKNDIQFGYAFVRQEQDSVIASFDESDQRAPTNVLQHRFYALWKMRPNTVAAFTWWHGRTLNPFLQNAALAPAGVPGTNLVLGQQEPSLNRLQFDLIYSF